MRIVQNSYIQVDILAKLLEPLLLLFYSPTITTFTISSQINNNGSLKVTSSTKGRLDYTLKPLFRIQTNCLMRAYYMRLKWFYYILRNKNLLNILLFVT